MFNHIAEIIKSLFKKPVPKGVRPVYPYGSISKHYSGLVSKMKPGDVLIVPAGNFDVEILRSSISSYSVKQWGCGSAKTKTSAFLNAVTVRRIK